MTLAAYITVCTYEKIVRQNDTIEPVLDAITGTDEIDLNEVWWELQETAAEIGCPIHTDELPLDHDDIEWALAELCERLS